MPEGQIAQGVPLLDLMLEYFADDGRKLIAIMSTAYARSGSGFVLSLSSSHRQT
jgi:hypothetical protein